MKNVQLSGYLRLGLFSLLTKKSKVLVIIVDTEAWQLKLAPHSFGSTLTKVYRKNTFIRSIKYPFESHNLLFHFT